MNIDVWWYDDVVVNQISRLIEPQIPKLKFYCKKEGIRTDSNWEYNVSEEYLKTFMHEDLCVCKESNKFTFSVQVTNKLLHIVKELYPDRQVVGSGHYYYPKTGYMGWHTNSNQPDDRLYITYASEDKKSFFRYYVDGKVVTDYDNKGFNFRTFSLSDKEPYFWHCVGSECDRFSFGYRLVNVLPLYK